MRSSVKHFYEFGPFRLDAEKLRLTRDGEIVPLPRKDIESLLVLVRNPGKPLEREELMQAVWGDTVVEDANLTVAISHLRKALETNGDAAEYIETLPRVGYRFVADVRAVVQEPKPLIVEKHTLSRMVIEEELVHDEPGEQEEVEAILARPVVVKRGLALTSRRATTSLAVVGALLAFAFAYLWHWRSSPAAVGAANIKSIAVLPLRSANQSADDQALSFGFADALMTSLGRVNGVRVLSANAVSRYANLQKEPVEIGRDLGVDGVLDGTLQRANSKLRVTLRLIRTSDGAQIWSNSFDEAETEVFKLQDAMAAQTAQSLKWNLSEEQRRQIAKRYTENGDAYQAYLRGRLFFDKRTWEGYEKALAEFQRAIELDPKYALAYSGLADVYALQAVESSGDEREALYERARTAGTNALQLDETLAEAHTSLAWIRRIHDWDWKGAEREFKRAIELNPNYVNAHQWYGFLLITLGRADEALAEMQKAREIDPFARSVLSNYLGVKIFRREYNEIPFIVQQILNLEEDKPNNQRILSIEYLIRGDYAKVIEIGNEVPSSDGQKHISDYLTANLAVAYARTGQQAKASEMLAYLEPRAKTNSETAYRLAMACSDLGRKEEAIALLEKCLEARDDRMVWIKVEPRFDPLRNDARFQEIVRRMNL